jgi:acyl-CoA dehydrogenase
MDFDFSDEQQAISDLAGQILGDKVTHESLKDLERTGDWFAADAWHELAKAGLLGIALPERDGGGGFGVLEACFVLEQIGRTVAPVPYLACIVGGAMSLAEHGNEAQRSALLPGVVAGESFLSVAYHEEGNAIAPLVPVTGARRNEAADGWLVDGEKWFVPIADRAARVLVPARTPDGEVIVALVDPNAAGVELEALATTDGAPEFVLTLRDVAVADDDILGDPSTGSDVVRELIDRMTVGVCALQAGVCDAAMKLTATYTSERKQFDTPIATFQAVAHRAADAFIDANAVRFTMWQAAWRLSEGYPAADAIDVAKFWAADGGQRMLHGCQHLHGGIGVDTDYALHRYFRWGKHLELMFGGATEHLRLLGARFAAAPA